MSSVFVHPRVAKRHAELEEEDVLVAWRNAFEIARRDSGDAVY